MRVAMVSGSRKRCRRDGLIGGSSARFGAAPAVISLILLLVSGGVLFNPSSGTVSAGGSGGAKGVPQIRIFPHCFVYGKDRSATVVVAGVRPFQTIGAFWAPRGVIGTGLGIPGPGYKQANAAGVVRWSFPAPTHDAPEWHRWGVAATDWRLHGLAVDYFRVVPRC